MEIAKASPILSWTIVDDEGTIFPGPASTTFGISKFMSADLYRIEFFLETIPIKIIFLFLFTYCIIFFSSTLSPLKLISINISLEHICPKSRWEQEEESTKNEEENDSPIVSDKEEDNKEELTDKEEE